MAEDNMESLAALLRKQNAEITEEWSQLLQRNLLLRNNLLKPGELDQQAREFMSVLVTALEKAPSDDLMQSQDWSPVRDYLGSVSRARARQGFTPTETAMFVFSLRDPLLALIRRNTPDDAEKLAEQTIAATRLLDRLGLYTMEIYQKGREEVILRQQQELMELSTPVVQLWRGILALPLIGTLDSARTQVVMESLLQAIVTTESAIAIIDITGVPVVDTLVAQHLLKTVAAARLMGADCIISGIRPQIAQTIVHLGVEINDVVTKATLADAFTIALRRLGLTVSRRAEGSAPMSARELGKGD
jgi:rsbT co-antagonist protein RsbR